MQGPNRQPKESTPRPPLQGEGGERAEPSWPVQERLHRQAWLEPAWQEGGESLSPSTLMLMMMIMGTSISIITVIGIMFVMTRCLEEYLVPSKKHGMIKFMLPVCSSSTLLAALITESAVFGDMSKCSNDVDEDDGGAAKAKTMS
eukprot:10537725-Lingulodinium_polyedra.AAC.1